MYAGQQSIEQYVTQIYSAVDGSQATVRGASGWVIAALTSVPPAFDGTLAARSLRKAVQSSYSHTQRLHMTYTANDMLCLMQARLAQPPSTPGEQAALANLQGGLRMQLPCILSATLLSAAEGSEREGARDMLTHLVELWRSRELLDPACCAMLQAALFSPVPVPPPPSPHLVALAQTAVPQLPTGCFSQAQPQTGSVPLHTVVNLPHNASQLAPAPAPSAAAHSLQAQAQQGAYWGPGAQQPAHAQPPTSPLHPSPSKPQCTMMGGPDLTRVAPPLLVALVATAASQPGHAPYDPIDTAFLALSGGVSRPFIEPGRVAVRLERFLSAVAFLREVHAEKARRLQGLPHRTAADRASEREGVAQQQQGVQRDSGGGGGAFAWGKGERARSRSRSRSRDRDRRDRRERSRSREGRRKRYQTPAYPSNWSEAIERRAAAAGIIAPPAALSSGAPAGQQHAASSSANEPSGKPPQARRGEEGGGSASQFVGLGFGGS